MWFAIDRACKHLVLEVLQREFLVDAGVVDYWSVVAVDLEFDLRNDTSILRNEHVRLRFEEATDCI